MTGMNSAVIWLVLVIVLLAIEIATLGLTTVWFARRGGSSIYLYLFWCEYGSPDRNFSGTVTDFTVGYKTGSHALYEKGTGKNQCGQSDRQNSRSTKEINNLAQTGELTLPISAGQQEAG